MSAMSNQKISIRHQNARALAEDGVPVFPVWGRDGKHGFIIDGKSTWGETTDLAQIDAWWSQADFNYAYRPWHLGCIVIDLDLYKMPPDGAALLATIPSDTYTVLTPSGGEHRYLDCGGIMYPNKKLAPWIDTRCAYGYVLGPGSRCMKTGREYRVKL